jgi:hypothetical protein
VNGPVPTGVSSCSGRIGIASPGSKACGSLNETTTVEASDAVTSVMSLSHCAYCEVPWSWIIEKVKATSSAVNGWPSCHFTPLLRWYVIVPSLAASVRSARPGTMLSWAS